MRGSRRGRRSRKRTGGVNDGVTTSVPSINRAHLMLSSSTTDEDQSVTALDPTKSIPAAVDVQVSQDCALAVVTVGLDRCREVARVVTLGVFNDDRCSRVVFGETAGVDALPGSGEDDGRGVRVDLEEGTCERQRGGGWRTRVSCCPVDSLRVEGKVDARELGRKGRGRWRCLHRQT